MCCNTCACHAASAYILKLLRNEIICEVNFKFTFHRDKITSVQLSARAEGIPNFSANLWQHISKTRICRKGEPQKHQVMVIYPNSHLPKSLCALLTPLLSARRDTYPPRNKNW